MAKLTSFLILLFSLCAVNALPQTQVVPQTESNLYAAALSACVSKEYEEYKDITDTRRTFFNRIVEQDIFLTDKLPTQFGQFKVEYLDANGLAGRYKKTRQKLSVFVFRPLKNNGSLLQINLAHYYVSHSKRGFVYELEGGCGVEFRYDCPLKKFVLSKVDLSGV